VAIATQSNFRAGDSLPGITFAIARKNK